MKDDNYPEWYYSLSEAEKDHYKKDQDRIAAQDKEEKQRLRVHALKMVGVAVGTHVFIKKKVRRKSIKIFSYAFIGAFLYLVFFVRFGIVQSEEPLIKRIF